MSQNNFYVYVLFDQHGVPRYVGKGKNKRWFNHERNWDKDANKLKRLFIKSTLKTLNDIPKVKVCENVSEDVAFETEKQLILSIGRLDIKTGPLVNMTSGGEGFSNYLTSNRLIKRNLAIKKAHLKISPERKIDIERKRQHTLSKTPKEVRSRINSEAQMRRDSQERQRQAALASAAVTKTKWINNGIINKRIRLKELIPNGWQEGRLYKPSDNFTKNTASTVWINNGKQSRRFKGTILLEGWSYGRKPKEAPILCKCGCMKIVHRTSVWARGHYKRKSSLSI